MLFEGSTKAQLGCPVPESTPVLRAMGNIPQNWIVAGLHRVLTEGLLLGFVLTLAHVSVGGPCVWLMNHLSRSRQSSGALGAEGTLPEGICICIQALFRGVQAGSGDSEQRGKHWNSRTVEAEDSLLPHPSMQAAAHSCAADLRQGPLLQVLQ